MSGLLQKRQKFGFANDADLVTLFDQFFGPAVLTAFAVTGQQIKVLVANDQQVYFLGYARLDGDSGIGGDFCGVRPGQGNLPGEASNVAVKGAVWVAFGGYVALEILPVASAALVVSGGEDFAVGFSGVFFRQQDNLRGGAGILFGVVVFEVQPKFGFQIGQPVAAIALEVWPRPAGDFHTVKPVRLNFRQFIDVASHVQRGLIKVAVLYQRAVLQLFSQHVIDFVKGRHALHFVFGDAVDAFKRRVELLFGVDQGSGGDYLAVFGDACQPDLTDRKIVGIGRFNVNRDEAKILIWKVFHLRFSPVAGSAVELSRAALILSIGRGFLKHLGRGRDGSVARHTVGGVAAQMMCPPTSLKLGAWFRRRVQPFAGGVA